MLVFSHFTAARNHVTVVEEAIEDCGCCHGMTDPDRKDPEAEALVNRI